MAKPLVSVVIISYNSRPYIEKCLRSLFAQKYSNFEVIMVINGSEDGSKELIEKLTRRRKKVRLIDPGENLWFSRGNNLGRVCSSTEPRYYDAPRLHRPASQ